MKRRPKGILVADADAAKAVDERKETLLAVRISAAELARLDAAVARFKGGALAPSRSQMIRVGLALGLERLAAMLPAEIGRVLLGDGAQPLPPLGQGFRPTDAAPPAPPAARSTWVPPVQRPRANTGTPPDAPPAEAPPAPRLGAITWTPPGARPAVPPQ